MRHAKTRVPVHFTPRPHPTVSNVTFSNWAGYYNTGKTFSTVGATWTVPAVPTTSPRDSSTWVGLGQGWSMGDPLIQAGNDQSGWNGHTYYGVWYEIWTLNTNQEYYTGWAPTPGHTMQVQVWVGGRTAHFFLEDMTTSTYQSFQIDYDPAITGCVCNTADYIEENQGEPNPLANFGAVTFTGAYSYDTANALYHVGDLNRTTVTMADNYGTVAYPGPIATNNTDFTIYRTSTP